MSVEWREVVWWYRYMIGGYQLFYCLVPALYMNFDKEV